MYVKNTQKGLGLAGLSLVAALMISGAAFAQDAGDGADGTDVEIAGDDGMFGDGGVIVIDQICIDCMGDGDYGDVDAGTDGDDGDIYVEDEDVGGDDGEVLIDPVDCDGDACMADGDPLELDPGDPVIYYNTAGGEFPGASPEVIRGDHLSSGSQLSVMQRGPDLCAAPAQELVWLCAALNGKSKSE